MKVIYVTGFMGAGKTTVGRVLGEVLQIPVYDTDDWVVKQKGKAIKEIFTEEGEAQFRAYETAVLSVLPTENAVVTTGGGIVMKAENRKRMRANGYVVYLFCDLEEIKRRIGNDPERPLLQQGDDSFRQLYERRQGFYEDADYIVDTTNQSIDEIVMIIQEWIRQNGE